jgi:hypothetical protein
VYHPLYYQCRGWVGRNVTVHHLNGTVYQGTLMNVAPHGIYMLQQRRIQPGYVSYEGNSHQDIVSGESAHEVGADARLVYYPGSYFAFGALAGLSLGALAGGFLW